MYRAAKTLRTNEWHVSKPWMPVVQFRMVFWIEGGQWDSKHTKHQLACKVMHTKKRNTFEYGRRNCRIYNSMSKPNRKEFGVCSFLLLLCLFVLFVGFVVAVLFGSLWGSNAHTLCYVCLIFILFHFIRSTCSTQLFKLKFITVYEMNWIYSVIWIYKKGTLAHSAWVCLCVWCCCCCCCFTLWSTQHIKTVSLLQFGWFPGNRIRIPFQVLLQLLPLHSLN